MDAFTGYFSLFLLKAVITKEMAQCLLKYVTIHSMPPEIVTDGGAQKELFVELTQIWGTHHAKVSLYNHKGNGKVGTIHSPVKNMMRALCPEISKGLWDLLLPIGGICLQYPSSFCNKTKTFHVTIWSNTNISNQCYTGNIKPKIGYFR